jgi:hypothetical protein
LTLNDVGVEHMQENVQKWSGREDSNLRLSRDPP